MYFFLLTVVTAVSNRASSFVTIHRLLSETSTNSSQSDTLQVKSPILVIQTDLCYLVGSPKQTISILILVLKIR